MQTSTIKYTFQDYVTLPENGKRYEIMEGELFMTPAPQVYHQIVLSNLEQTLRNIIQANKLGIVLIAPTDVVFSEENVVQPDILFISSNRRSIVSVDNIKGAPDLIVEVLSKRTQSIDRKQKRQLYEKFGVREYWMVDPDGKNIELLVLEHDRYRSFGPIFQGSVQSYLLPDLVVKIEDVFSTP